MDKSKLEAEKAHAEKEISQLENRQKILLNRIRKEERNARTSRLICKWFRAAVLPLDGVLYTALFPQGGMKVCAECQRLFRPGSNRAKYCPACASKVHRRQKAASERRRRASGVDN